MTSKPLRLSPPNYDRHEYEDDLATREVLELLRPESAHMELDGGMTVFSPSRPKSANRLTFFHAFGAGPDMEPTLQSLAEGDGGGKNSTYASHGIHTYRGKFYPQLARVLLNLSGLQPGDTVLDPFGGSGTTATEAALMGAEAVTVDWNPLASHIAHAKLDALSTSPADLISEGERWTEAASRNGSVEWGQFHESVHEELESWFPLPVLAKLSHLLAAIRMTDDPKLVRIAEVLVSDVVRDVSHQEPRDLRVRRRAEPLEDADVAAEFQRRHERLVKSLSDFQQARLPHAPRTARVVTDSIDPVSSNGTELPARRSVDAVVTSPPYATALPYLDTDRLSLALILGYSSSDRRELEEQLIGSREFRTSTLRAMQSQLEDLEPSELLPPSTCEFLTTLHDAAMSDPNAGFRRQQKPAALFRYFTAMARTLESVHALLKPGASAWFVVGDSRTKLHGSYRRIPTTDEIASTAKHLGYEVEERIPITVTRDGLMHSRNRITENAILRFRA